MQTDRRTPGSPDHDLPPWPPPSQTEPASVPSPVQPSPPSASPATDTMARPAPTPAPPLTSLPPPVPPPSPSPSPALQSAPGTTMAARPEPPAATGRTPKERSWPAQVLRAGAFLVAALTLGSIVGLVSTGGGGGVVGDVAGTAWDEWRTTVLNPWYGAFLAVLLALEWRFPARRELPGISVGLGEDLVWFVMSTTLGVTVVAGYLALLEAAYTDLAGGANLNLESRFGSWGLPLLALIVTDLLAWFSHYLHHKVPVLWSFHAVHHSQEQMNVLSDSRQHVVETMITATLVFLPARILGLDLPAASALTFLSIYVGAFIHANIRTNLGPARFVVISPQAHRVHHSAAPEHIDTNFGVILAGWDYLFGTRYVDDDEYPTTGIHDRSFPLERSAHPWSLLTTWLRQTAYPFRVLATRRADSALVSASIEEEPVEPAMVG